MISSELKKQLIQKIQTTTDINVLEEMYRILYIGTKDIETIVLSASQKNRIDQGLHDVEEGRYLTPDHANREIEEWLKK